MNRSPIPVLQHISCETLGIIENSLQDKKLAHRYVRSFAGDVVPESIGDAPALIVLGGPMGVYDAGRFPYLKKAMKLIESAIQAGRPVLGVCLGSQLLAHVLGAHVRPSGYKEIGWHPVTFTEEGKKDRLFSGVKEGSMFHWHGDVFDLPSGATALASSPMTTLQAYRYGKNVYGFLFHMEVGAPMIEEWVKTFDGELKAARIDGQKILKETPENLPALNAAGKTVFDAWAALST